MQVGPCAPRAPACVEKVPHLHPYLESGHCDHNHLEFGGLACQYQHLYLCSLPGVGDRECAS